MPFTHEDSWDAMARIVASHATAREAWNNFIDHHQEIVTSFNWNLLRDLKIESEQIEIINWLQHLLTAEPMPETTTALWIGLFTSADNQEEIPAIHICGCDEYSSDDSDWASTPTYLPKGRYAQPRVLQNLQRIIYTDKNNYEFLDWIFPLAYCAFTFDEIFRTKLNRSLMLNNRPKLYISVGYDSGDYIELTTII